MITERPPTPAEEAAFDEFEARANGTLDEFLRDRDGDTETLATRKGGARSAFSKLEAKLGKKKKNGKKAIKDPGGLAYAIGAAKYGKAGMAKKAAAGKAKAKGK